MIADERLGSRAKIVGTLGIGFGFFAGAGVTGLSLLIGVIGLWALVYGVTNQRQPLITAAKSGLTTHWLAWILFASFVCWVLVSATWSPATKLAGESVRRILAMFLLAPIAVWAASSADPKDQLVAQRGLLAALGIALFILVFEAVFDSSINRLASPEKDMRAIDGDLGRAATASLALFWAGFAVLRKNKSPTIGILLLVGAVGYIAFQFDTHLNGLGIVIGTLAALFALFFPRVALGGLSAVCAVIVMSAPMLYPLITKAALHLSPDGQLPLSYARRAQMWQVASDLIAQKPITGWGLGAGSTFDRVISFGGFDWPLIQLHPHAAPMHIWLETGAVGATLASLTIIAAGGAAVGAFGRHRAACSALVGGLTFLAINWAFSHAAWREWMWTSFAVLLVFAFSLRDQKSSAISKAAEL